MRWTLTIVLAFASVAAAQQPSSRTPPPPGVDISARDGDRIVVDDDARIQSWEALTTLFQYEGEAPLSRGLGLTTPQGLVQLSPSRLDAHKPDPSATTVLTFRGSSSTGRRGLSFAEAETLQFQDYARSRASGATVSTVMGAPNSAGVTGRGAGSASATIGTAVVTGGIRGPSGTPRKIRDVAPHYPEAARQANVSGVVILQLSVGVDGTVTDARVLRSIPAFDAAALEAVRQWQYEPTVLNGQAVPVSVTVTVPFTP
jgi:TonB family protein